MSITVKKINEAYYEASATPPNVRKLGQRQNHSALIQYAENSSQEVLIKRISAMQLTRRTVIGLRNK